MDRRAFNKLFSAAFGGISSGNLETTINAVASLGTKAEVIKGLIQAFNHIRNALYFNKLAEKTASHFILNSDVLNPKEHLIGEVPIQEQLNKWIKRSDDYFEDAAKNFAKIFEQIPVEIRSSLFGFSDFFNAVRPKLNNEGVRFLSELTKHINYNIRECPKDLGNYKHWRDSAEGFGNLKERQRSELNNSLDIIEKKQDAFDNRQSYSAVFPDMASAKKALQYPAKTVQYQYRTKIPYETHNTDPQQNDAHRKTWELKLRYTDSSTGELVADRSKSCESNQR